MANLDQQDRTDLKTPPVPALLGFYDAILAGDADALVAMFPDEPRIDTPLEGAIEGARAFRRFVSGQRDWLRERLAVPHFTHIVLGAERLVVEFSLDLVRDDSVFDLPVAIAADRDGSGVSALRVYHSTWPLTGAHVVRAPILPIPEGKLAEPEVIEAYMAGIRKPDRELVLSLFTEDGYVRQPSGERFKHAGAEGLREFYGPALDAGGVVLHHCTATFDGQAFAVEFICDEWANVKLPPQAGLAVYELAGPDKIRAARIYDDVTPPLD